MSYGGPESFAPFYTLCNFIEFEGFCSFIEYDVTRYSKIRHVHGMRDKVQLSQVVKWTAAIFRFTQPERGQILGVVI